MVLKSFKCLLKIWPNIRILGKPKSGYENIFLALLHVFLKGRHLICWLFFVLCFLKIYLVPLAPSRLSLTENAPSTLDIRFSTISILSDFNIFYAMKFPLFVPNLILSNNISLMSTEFIVIQWNFPYVYRIYFHPMKISLISTELIF